MGKRQEDFQSFGAMELRFQGRGLRYRAVGRGVEGIPYIPTRVARATS